MTAWAPPPAPHRRAADGGTSGHLHRPMSFTDIFIRRPVLASVVSLLIFILGLRAFWSWRCASTRRPRTRW
jgi:hypothetical protein